MRKINIAVDGTAGSGKTFIFKKVADKVGYKLIDTGLMYRAFTYFNYLRKTDFTNKQQIIDSLKDFTFDIVDGKVLINNDTLDITDMLSSKEVTNNINKVTIIPEVREVMVELQRKIGDQPGVIELGRDITTIVLPNADMKIYLDSPIEVRAKRRYNQNLEEGINESYEDVYNKIAARDNSDKTREVGPLVIANDAWYIDSSIQNSPEELVDEIVAKIKDMEVK